MVCVLSGGQASTHRDGRARSDERPQVRGSCLLRSCAQGRDVPSVGQPASVCSILDTVSLLLKKVVRRRVKWSSRQLEFLRRTSARSRVTELLGFGSLGPTTIGRGTQNRGQCRDDPMDRGCKSTPNARGDLIMLMTPSNSRKSELHSQSYACGPEVAAQDRLE